MLLAWIPCMPRPGVVREVWASRHGIWPLSTVRHINCRSWGGSSKCQHGYWFSIRLWLDQVHCKQIPQLPSGNAVVPRILETPGIEGSKRESQPWLRELPELGSPKGCCSSLLLFTCNMASKGLVSALFVWQLIHPYYSSDPEVLSCVLEKWGTWTSRGWARKRKALLSDSIPQRRTSSG